ncbi:MAG: FAD-dependent oxidoreductase [Acidobacteria bacterium]|nr:FAD-dependent oxidoreductase [Acidobacteriota bacterium]
MTSLVNRRQFLRAVPAAGAALRGQTPAAKRVLIAGAGMAGLASALQLVRRGYDVTIFEGQGRPGGRVQTLREGLAPGLTAETGATRIPDTHFLTLSYAREFGLALEPFHAPVGLDTFHVRGQDLTVRNGKEPEWPLNLTAEERKLGREGMAAKYFGPAVAQAVKQNRLRQVPDAVMAQDEGPIAEYLKKRGLSADAVELVNFGFATTFGAGLTFLDAVSEHVEKSYFHIAGGNDKLPFALAERLGARIRYGHRIVAMEQSDSSATLIVEHEGERQKHTAPHLICALPFSVTGGLFEGARLPAQKQELTAGMPYLASDKIFLQMRRQFWREKGRNGFAYTDLLSERFWALGPAEAEKRGLLISYTIGPKAEKLDKMTARDRLAVTLADAEQVFPGAREHFESVRVKSWAADPWVRGLSPDYGPGQLKRIAAAAQREGRIHFAGEHTSRWTGWIQGALDSAHRVVDEITSAA